jgi:TonB-dependent receptor
MNADCLRLAKLIVLMLSAVALSTPSAAQPEGEGSLRGQITDTESGAALEGVTVTVIWQTSSAGTEPRQKVDVTDANGIFKFASVPAGNCSIKLSKPGYRVATTPNIDVKPGEETRADLAIAALPPEAASAPAPGAAPGVEEFVIVASPLTEILGASRMDSDELINTLNADELAKFAASDVADALKFVAGVNVVEGQFAIIRGLEDRYSSTLYNFAPIPSPDPDSQSVQLDLFPSDIVSNLVVAKTFGPDLPSNSSGGSINIITHDYPEELEIKINAGTGFETYAKDRFFAYNGGIAVGTEESGLSDVLESDLGISVGGPFEVLDREIRFKGLFTREIDYRTAEGFQESLEPVPTGYFRNNPTQRVISSGGLSLGELFLSGGNFDFTESEKSKQTTGYGGLGFDIDPDGNHKIDGSYFYTKRDEDVVQVFGNGYLPNFDYSQLAALQAEGQEIQTSFFNKFATETAWIARTVRSAPDNGPTRGPLWYTNFNESASFATDRDLEVWQLNGDHQIEQIEGLHFTWAANQADTTQSEYATGLRYFFEPDDLTQIPPTTFPVEASVLGPGQYATNGGIFLSTNEIHENQDFGRLDGEYETDLLDILTIKVGSGGWYEKATRDVASTFLEGPTRNGSTQFAVLGDTPQELAENLFDDLDREEDDQLSVTREATNQSEREIEAVHLSAKATLWDQLDLMGGVRGEHIFIQSLNEPFIEDQLRFGAPATFPEVYILFDRLDNPARGEVSRAVPPGTVFNDQILGIDIPVNSQTGFVDLLTTEEIDEFVNGTIDERKLLPSAGFAYRPIDGLAVRGAYSQTVARPSFREMGFYVSVEPATDDLVVGNPQLKLSDVESFDLRAEYSWGDLGDLVAVSGFQKSIRKPIESIVLRNPINFEASSSSLYRTFFNNENEATLYGIEVEGRKSIDFVGVEFLEHFSIGGNYTYINAKVGRSQAEIDRADPFFGVVPGEIEYFTALDDTRRLFNQPEWIANVDIAFDHEDWGTRISLNFFAISSVLDAAGSAFILPNGLARDFTPDRYVDSFQQLDLVASQRIWGGLSVKFSAKNLTNSERRIIYDTSQTREKFTERAFKIGRDYSISLSYTYTF